MMTAQDKMNILETSGKASRITQRNSSCRFVIGTLLAAVIMIGNSSAAFSGDTERTPADDLPGKQINPSTTEPTAAETKTAAPDTGTKPANQEPAPTNPSVAPVPPQQTAPRPAEKKPPVGYDDAVKLYKAGKFALATPKFEKFVKDGAADGNCHLYLSACYRNLKQWSKAIAEYDWLAKNSKSITQKRTAKNEATTLRCYQKGICPGKCLKTTTPGWHRMTVAGHDPNELWMTFTYKGGSHSWSQAHIGEVIDYENGEPVNKGKCPICNGTGRVQPLK